jgi:hypothetical protein
MHVIKIVPFKTILGIGERDKRRMMEGVNSNMTYCKDFHKCHNVPLSSTTIEKNHNLLVKIPIPIAFSRDVEAALFLSQQVFFFFFLYRMSPIPF